MNLMSSENTDSSQSKSDTSWHVLLILIGAVFTALSVDIARKSPGQPGDPGPGALPFWLSIFLLGAGVYGVIHQVWHRNLSFPRLSLNWNASYTFGVGTFFFIFAIEYLGFLTAGFIYSLGLSRFLGTSWRWSLGITVLLLAGIQLLFVWFFQVQLPTNAMGF